MRKLEGHKQIQQCSKMPETEIGHMWVLWRRPLQPSHKQQENPTRAQATFPELERTLHAAHGTPSYKPNQKHLQTPTTFPDLKRTLRAAQCVSSRVKFLKPVFIGFGNGSTEIYFMLFEMCELSRGLAAACFEPFWTDVCKIHPVSEKTPVCVSRGRQC